MVPCPVCHGIGEVDFRDADAYMAEHFLDATPLGVQECDECEGTGEITEERDRELMVWVQALIDRCNAQLIAEGRLLPDGSLPS